MLGVQLSKVKMLGYKMVVLLGRKKKKGTFDIVEWNLAIVQ